MPQHLRSALLLTFVLTITHAGPALSSVGCKKGLSPAEDFACNANISFLACKLEGQLAELIGNYDKVNQCTSKWEKNIKPVYESAKKKLSNNAGAAKALKDLYAYWLSSMNALIPSPNETKGHYDAKIEERDQGIADRASKLRIEAE